MSYSQDDDNNDDTFEPISSTDQNVGDIKIGDQGEDQPAIIESIAASTVYMSGEAIVDQEQQVEEQQELADQVTQDLSTSTPQENKPAEQVEQDKKPVEQADQDTKSIEQVQVEQDGQTDKVQEHTTEEKTNDGEQPIAPSDETANQPEN